VLPEVKRCAFRLEEVKHWAKINDDDETVTLSFQGYAEWRRETIA
jgi:hypothetical protein